MIPVGTILAFSGIIIPQGWVDAGISHKCVDVPILCETVYKSLIKNDILVALIPKSDKLVHFIVKAKDFE
jgi:hypothetical protein